MHRIAIALTLTANFLLAAACGDNLEQLELDAGAAPEVDAASCPPPPRTSCPPEWTGCPEGALRLVECRLICEQTASVCAGADVVACVDDCRAYRFDAYCPGTP